MVGKQKLHTRDVMNFSSCTRDLMNFGSCTGTGTNQVVEKKQHFYFEVIVYYPRNL